jgi:hypothetical protein
MQLDKSQVIEFLKEHGQHSEAEQAEQHLPEQVDTDQHGGLLAQLGISVQDLLGSFGGEGLGKLV